MLSRLAVYACPLLCTLFLTLTPFNCLPVRRSNCCGLVSVPTFCPSIACDRTSLQIAKPSYIHMVVRSTSASLALSVQHCHKHTRHHTDNATAACTAAHAHVGCANLAIATASINVQQTSCTYTPSAGAAAAIRCLLIHLSTKLSA